MDTIVLIGGAGTVGRALAKGLSSHYKVIILDLNNPNLNHPTVQFQQANALNKNELIQHIPSQTVALINLLNSSTQNSLNETRFHEMTDIFFRASYHVFQTAVEKKIPKVIFASTNHITDGYEDEGMSLLNREITTEDVPKSKGLYGVLKFASEQLGLLFSDQQNLSVINIRIGSFPKDASKQALIQNKRLQHTLLTEQDLVQYFLLALEPTSGSGTYYAVSDNEGKPWSTERAQKELRYHSLRNAQDVLRE
ncbi:NAD-dependent epimerase/dehydratase family protein [Alkalihalobacillus sp. NPDC078783]